MRRRRMDIKRRKRSIVPTDANMMESVIIDTGGACSGRTCHGGWACIVRIQRIGANATEHSGSVPASTSSNRMELTAVIEALYTIQDRLYDIQLVSASEYVVDGINRWRHIWRENRWITSTKTPVLNVDLWQTIDELTEQHCIRCTLKVSCFK